MLAAEFHYSPLIIDEQMDMQLFEGHMRYREFSPPVGALLKTVLTALADSKDGAPAKGSASKEPQTEEEQLAELVAMFGSAGGKVEKVHGEGGEN